MVLLLMGFSCLSKAQVNLSKVSVNNYGSSIRGLYAVKKDVVWAAGSGGVVMKTIDGESWVADTIEGCKNLDFRDIHAFDKKTAVVMSSGEGCFIYHTSDGGETWEVAYEDTNKTIFFDGMDFWDAKNGLAYGDPVNGQMQLLVTSNGGKTWKKFTPESIPKMLDGEAGFAASGTGIVCKGTNTVWIATGGGKIARVFKSDDRGLTWQVVNTPLRSGEGNGIYSITFSDLMHGVAVGGNYLDSTNASGSCAITEDGGMTWQLITTNGPRGYRSCVSMDSPYIIAAGRTGLDVSTDRGNYWMPLSNEGYYSCVIKDGVAWLSGRKGKLAKLTFK